MKVVVAVDSFKGSMSSREAGNAVKEGVLRVYPDAEVVVRALADGGEGTVEALMEGLGGEKVNITVTGPNLSSFIKIFKKALLFLSYLLQ